MKKVLKSLTVCLLVAVLTGCSQDAGYTLKLEGLANESGDFQFQELEWDCNPSEAEGMLKCTLEDMGGADTIREYKAVEACSWDGVKGDLFCEFEQDKLDTVSIHFSPEEGEVDTFWENLKSELCELYGNVEETVQTSTAGDLQITTERANYLWESSGNRHTALSISRLSVNGQFKYIALNVYIVPEK